MQVTERWQIEFGVEDKALLAKLDAIAAAKKLSRADALRGALFSFLAKGVPTPHAKRVRHSGTGHRATA
jgi:hypothetical protein